MRIDVIVACGVLISGCASMNLEQQANIDSASLAQRGKAVVVISANVDDAEPTGKWIASSLATSWAPVAREAPGFLKTSVAFRTGALQDPKHPAVIEVAPGTYELTGWTFSNGRATISNAHTFQPGEWMARIEVRAGEVVYVGNAMYRTRTAGAAFTPGTFALSVTDEEAQARASLSANKPDLVALMTKRLMVIHPGYLFRSSEATTVAKSAAN